MTSPYFGVPPYPPVPPPTPPTDTRRWITIGLLVTVLGFGVGVGFAFAGRSNDDGDRVATASDRSETTRTEPATTTTPLPTTIPEMLEFTLVHRMSPSICKVQVSSTADAEWGPNRLEDDDRFETDDLRSFDAPYGDLLDLRATSCDGTETWSRRGVELDPDQQLVLNRNWSHTIVQTTTTGTTRPPATTSPPRTTASTRSPATTSPPRTTASTRSPATTSPPRTTPATTTPPSTEPPCPDAAVPQDVRYSAVPDTDGGVGYVNFQVSFRSCSPATDYQLLIADTGGVRLGGASYNPRFGDGIATFGWDGTANGRKWTYFRIPSDELRSSVRTATICSRIQASNGSDSWGQFCSTWDNPNPPSWDGRSYRLRISIDGNWTACTFNVTSRWADGWGPNLLDPGETMNPNSTWSMTVPAGPTKFRTLDCNGQPLLSRGNELIDSDRTYHFTGGVTYP